MDRRDFLKAIGLGAGAGLLGGRIGAAERSRPRGTPRPAPGQSTFTFAVAADPHASEQAKWAPPGTGTSVDRFLACVRAMEELPGDERPDFMLVVGDVHLWTLKDHLDRVTIPMHVIAGNHEGSRAKRQEMRDLFPADFKRDGKEADYYSFVHKGVRFVGVCDASAGDHIGHLCSEIIRPRGQCEWLEAELTAAEPQKIVFAHIPTEPEGDDRYGYLNRNDSRWLNALVKRTRPTAMFFGHRHRGAEFTVGTTPCHVIPSCCWNAGRESLGFRLVRVGPKGMTMRHIITARYAEPMGTRSRSPRRGSALSAVAKRVRLGPS